MATPLLLQFQWNKVMAEINLKTRDYVIESLNQKFDVSLIQAIIMRLLVHRGKYWANPNLGSRLHLLRRSKDVPRNLLLAEQYAYEALEDMEDSRVVNIDVTATQSEKSRIDLLIEITQLTGEKQSILYFVPVGG